MQIGKLKAGAGEHVFGYLETGRSRSGLSPDIPLHIFAGAETGPTLLVEATVHGNELIGTCAILNVVKILDPRKLRGNLVAVPVLNRIGFELQDRGSKIDGKDILRLFPGKPAGSVSDQLAYIYFEEVIRRANVVIDFHAGGQTAYERYICFTADRNPNNLNWIEAARHKLVVAFGLDSAAYFPRGIFTGTESEDAIEAAGVVMFTPELGGGTGWYKNGEDNVRVAEAGIWNTMKAMRMIEGEFESDGPFCTIYSAGVVLWKPAVDGFFVRKKRFGELVKEGEVYASLVDPYTGNCLMDIANTAEAIVIPSGQEWFTIGATSVGILGTIDRIEDRRTFDPYVSFE